MIKLALIIMAQQAIAPLPALDVETNCGVTPAIVVGDVPQNSTPCWQRGSDGRGADGTDVYDPDAAKAERVVMTLLPEGDRVAIAGRVYTERNLLDHLAFGMKLEKDDPIIIRTPRNMSGQALSDLRSYLSDAGYTNISVIIQEAPRP